MLDHVDLADQVGDGDVGRGQFLLITIGRGRPRRSGCRRPSTATGRGLLGERRIGIVVDLGPLDDRHGVVEQVDQLAEHPGLGLASEAEEEHVVAREDGVLDLGDDGLFIAEDVGEEGFALADPWR